MLENVENSSGTGLLDCVMMKVVINMKVNYRRTVEKQREAEHQEWLRKRQEKLDAMTPEEREKYLADETQRARDALKMLGMAQAMLGDSPYSKI